MDTKPLCHNEDFIVLCNDAQSRVNEVSVAEVEQCDAHLLIDVRDLEEFTAGHIPGATHLSKGWIEAKIHNVAKDKQQKIILYCGGGNRSILAADNLQKMGYKSVLSMQGGIKAWVNANKSLEF